MPRNEEKRLCTVCNQIVDTEDYAESDTGSILGIHLEQVASIPEMKNAKRLANLEPNRMYLTCGNCTDTFLRMWQMLEHVQTQKAALCTARNGVGTSRAASMSTGNSNSLGGMPANTVSAVTGIDNKKEQSASKSIFIILNYSQKFYISRYFAGEVLILNILVTLFLQFFRYCGSFTCGCGYAIE